MQKTWGLVRLDNEWPNNIGQGLDTLGVNLSQMTSRPYGLLAIKGGDDGDYLHNMCQLCRNL